MSANHHAIAVCTLPHTSVLSLLNCRAYEYVKGYKRLVAAGGEGGRGGHVILQASAKHHMQSAHPPHIHTQAYTYMRSWHCVPSHDMVPHASSQASRHLLELESVPSSVSGQPGSSGGAFRRSGTRGGDAIVQVTLQPMHCVSVVSDDHARVHAR